MADSLEIRLLHAQTEHQAPIDTVSVLVGDELLRRQDRLLARRIKAARFRDANRTLDSFDFTFNPKIQRKLVFELATARFVSQCEDVLLLGPPGTGKSHLVQAIGLAAIAQGHRVLYREAHLLIIDDLGMRKLPSHAVENLLEIIMRRYERASTILTSNRPIEDGGKLLGDTAAVTATLDRLLHHAHLLKCGPRSWRSRARLPLKNTPRKG